MLKSTKNYGLIKDIITPDQYVFGNELVPYVLEPKGQWDNYLPTPEEQKQHGLETYNCTAYGTLNQIEILTARVFSKRWNKSERYVGFMADTKPPGNSPHKVMESIRATGLVDEELLPFDKSIDTLDEYYSLGSEPGKVRGEGEKWLDNYEFNHDWVFTTTDTLAKKQAKMIEALKTSPLTVTIFAWRKKDDIYYKKPEDSDNHYVVCYGYVKGKHWKIFDSYDNIKKKVAWDYNFELAKRISLKMRTTPRHKPNWVIRLLNDIWEILYSKN